MIYKAVNSVIYRHKIISVSLDEEGGTLYRTYIINSDNLKDVYGGFVESNNLEHLKKMVDILEPEIKGVKNEV